MNHSVLKPNGPENDVSRSVHDYTFEGLSRFLITGIADLVEGAFNQVFTLFTNIMIDRAHRLDRAGGWAGERELTIRYFTLVQCKCTVPENDKAAVCEIAGFIFVEVEDHFFVGKVILADFHEIISEVCF